MDGGPLVDFWTSHRTSGPVLDLSLTSGPLSPDLWTSLDLSPELWTSHQLLALPGLLWTFLSGLLDLSPLLDLWLDFCFWPRLPQS